MYVKEDGRGEQHDNSDEEGGNVVRKQTQEDAEHPDHTPQGFHPARVGGTHRLGQRTDVEGEERGCEGEDNEHGGDDHGRHRDCRLCRREWGATGILTCSVKVIVGAFRWCNSD